MYKRISYFGVFIVLIFSILSCEKVIEVELDTSPSQIVIEGSFTNVRGQQLVRISRSVPYTEPNVYPPVTGAAVTVTDNTGRQWVLTESTPGVYTVSSARGEANNTYTLSVAVGGTTYTARSKMPQVVLIDSLNFKELTFGDEVLKQVQVNFRDPELVPNYYRYVMKRNGVQIRQVFAENDRFNNGKLISNVLFNGDDDEELKSGDAVEVEMQSIDQPVFIYWYTMSQQTRNGPGGGVTPGNPPSNIDNGALGYFSAYSFDRKTIFVK